MFLDKLFLCVNNDLRLVSTVVTAGIGFLVRQKMHELKLDTQVVEALVYVPGKLNAKGLIESGDVAHNLGLAKHMVISKESFIGRAVQGNDIAKHASMFSLKVNYFPVRTFGSHPTFNLIERLTYRCELAAPTLAADTLQLLAQTIQGGASILNKLARLKVVKKFIVFWIQHAPGDQEVNLAPP